MSSTVLPSLTFASEPDHVRAVVLSERLNYGFMTNPTFATETALIDPLPHQRIAVYQHMLPQPRLRFLLADDAGAGKTIMAGLVIRDMLLRHRIRRVLIIPPAGLVTNWERELRTLFSLTFAIVSSSDARQYNPFIGDQSDLVIVSIDTLAGDRMFACLQNRAVVPYDLVIFDEAHKLSAQREKDFTIRKTIRYRLAQALAGIPADDKDGRWYLSWWSHHILLLTATPHMGKDYPYFALWHLLEPDILTTPEAFQTYPLEARQRAFLRRSKEEMISFAGKPLYPVRTSDSLSYTLSQGDMSEQTLYDKMTYYLSHTYNQAQMLNRQAARLAMSIFQRRLASSTWAVLRSLERRLAKLNELIEAITTKHMTLAQLGQTQQDLNKILDPFDTTTADEDAHDDGIEHHEQAEESLLGGVSAESLADLYDERDQVQELVTLAQQVHMSGQESKFTRLRDFLRDPHYANEKVLIFTEHRDTLHFLVQRFKGIGMDGHIATIHGGMPSAERDEQIAFFRAPEEQGGARYMIATDAAGEGVNLQFCWLMINYDIPWNPARLEQRLGRIHRYGQPRDQVVMINILASNTREGKVMYTLLEKLETIRKQLGSDKVFDVIGRLFEGESLTAYMQEVLMDTANTTGTVQRLQGKLTKEQITALAIRERSIYGEEGSVRAQLKQMTLDMDQELLRRLLPGAVRRFVEQAAPLVGLAPMGNRDDIFTFKPTMPHALDPFLPQLEAYPPPQRACFRINRPAHGDYTTAIFLRPGEPFFDRLCAVVKEQFQEAALSGALFADPTAAAPYLFHIATITLVRQADPTIPALAQQEVRETQLVAIRQQLDGTLTEVPEETFLLLRPVAAQVRSPAIVHSIAVADKLREQAKLFLTDHIATRLVESHRQGWLKTANERRKLILKGYNHLEGELANKRTEYKKKADRGDAQAKRNFTLVKQQQRDLATRRTLALATIQREPELLTVGEVAWVAHALVIPSTDPADRQHHDAAVEEVAMQYAQTYAETMGATVYDVSTPAGATAMNLEPYPGFDLLALLPNGERWCIEVKGRAARGSITLTENEWTKACTLRKTYWLYVVYNCASPPPVLLRVQDPFEKLIVRENLRLEIAELAIVKATE